MGMCPWEWTVSMGMSHVENVECPWECPWVRVPQRMAARPAANGGGTIIWPGPAVANLNGPAAANGRATAKRLGPPLRSGQSGRASCSYPVLVSPTQRGRTEPCPGLGQWTESGSDRLSHRTDSESLSASDGARDIYLLNMAKDDRYLR